MSNAYPPQGGYSGGQGNQPPSGKTKTLGLDYNIAALLCYVPICCLSIIAPILWLVTEPKDNRFVRFHAIQSLLLSAAAILLGVIFWIVIVVLAVGGSAAGQAGGAAAGLGALVITLLEIVVGLCFLVAWILGCIKAYQGQYFKLPIIGNIAESKA